MININQAHFIHHNPVATQKFLIKIFLNIYLLLLFTVLTCNPFLNERSSHIS